MKNDEPWLLPDDKKQQRRSKKIHLQRFERKFLGRYHHRGSSDIASPVAGLEEKDEVFTKHGLYQRAFYNKYLLLKRFNLLNNSRVSK